MENNKGNGFLNGFLLGAIIGAGAVFSLNTKKGKKILKLISEEGLDNISEFLDQQDQAGEDLDEEEVQEQDKKPLVRRFFRGITRKS